MCVRQPDGITTRPAHGSIFTHLAIPATGTQGGGLPSCADESRRPWVQRSHRRLTWADYQSHRSRRSLSRCYWSMFRGRPLSRYPYQLPEHTKSSRSSSARGDDRREECKMAEGRRQRQREWAAAADAPCQGSAYLARDPQGPRYESRRDLGPIGDPGGSRYGLRNLRWTRSRDRGLPLEMSLICWARHGSR